MGTLDSRVCTCALVLSVNGVRVQALSESAPDGEVLVKGFKVDMTRQYLRCLVPGEWLNDEVRAREGVGGVGGGVG